MPLSDISKYFASYDKTSFFVVACQGNEPSEADVTAFEADVTAFEADVGFRLPDDSPGVMKRLRREIKQSRKDSERIRYF